MMHRVTIINPHGESFAHETKKYLVQAILREWIEFHCITDLFGKYKIVVGEGYENPIYFNLTVKERSGYTVQASMMSHLWLDGKEPQE